MTQKTPYRNKILINHGPVPGYLSILLIDTAAKRENTPKYISNFLDKVKYQCIARPAEETVVCDSRLLDSIDFFGLQLEQDKELQPSLTRTWIIGHEIGHVVLHHKVDSRNLLLETLAETTGKNSEAQRDPDSAAIKQASLEEVEKTSSKKGKSCEEIGALEKKYYNRLFYMENEADKFALERIHPNIGMNVMDHHHGNWYMELVNKEIRRQNHSGDHRSLKEEDKGLSEGNIDPSHEYVIDVSVDLDGHLPTIWRLHHFLTEGERMYKDFSVPALRFVPQISFCFSRGKPEEQKAYYQNSFYIHGAEDTLGTRVLGRLTDDLLTRHAHAIGGPRPKSSKLIQSLMEYGSAYELSGSVTEKAFCEPKPDQALNADLSSMLKEACFAAVLGYFIEKDRCPPGDYLHSLASPQGPVAGNSESLPDEHYKALAVMTTLLADSCLTSEKAQSTFTAMLGSLHMLGQLGESGVPHLLLNNILDLVQGLTVEHLPEAVPAQDREMAVFAAKFNILQAARSEARSNLWFKDAAAISRRIKTLASEAKDDQFTVYALDFEREALLIELENGLGKRLKSIAEMEDLFKRSIQKIDEGKIDRHDPDVRTMLYEMANSSVYFSNIAGSCGEGAAWAKDAFDDLRSRFDVNSFPPVKLIASWVGIANCNNSSLPSEIVKRSKSLNRARLWSARVRDDKVEAEDALRGFVAIAVYHYLRGDLEEARKNAEIFIQGSNYDFRKRDDVRFEGMCFPADKRCIPVKDILKKRPYDPNNYDIIQIPEIGIVWEEVD